MNAFVLKIIALTSMIIDHMGAAFPQYFGLEFRVIGRLAFPIFVYLIAEGFRHTKSPEKFLVRLGVFALVSEPFFDLALRAGQGAWDYFDGNIFSFALANVSFFSNTNIFYTLFLGGAAIMVYEWALSQSSERKNRYIVPAFIPILALMFIAFVLSTDYAAYGVFFIIIMYVIKTIRLRLAVMAALCVWQHHWIVQVILEGGAAYLPIQFILFIPATLLTVPLVALYNGRRGPSFKWAFYASYPIHLAIIVLILAIM